MNGLSPNTRTWARGMLQKDELHAIAGRFSGPQAPVLLKGASLLGRIYLSPSERCMTDLDLWVPGPLWEQTKNVLAEIGYRPLHPDQWPSGRANFGRKMHEMEMVVELHEHLGPQGRITEKVFAASLPHPLFQGLRHMPLEEEFTFLCWHYAGQHTFLEPKWGRDLALFLDAYPQLDGLKVARLAKEWGVERAVEGACFSLERVMGMQLPPPLRPAMFLPLDQDFLAAPKRDLARYLAVKLLMREGPWEAVREGARAIRDAFRPS